MAKKSLTVQEVLHEIFEGSDVDEASGEESFYTDEEIDFLERLDPVEDDVGEELPGPSWESPEPPVQQSSSGLPPPPLGATSQHTRSTTRAVFRLDPIEDDVGEELPGPSSECPVPHVQQSSSGLPPPPLGATSQHTWSTTRAFYRLVPIEDDVAEELPGPSSECPVPHVQRSSSGLPPPPSQRTRSTTRATSAGRGRGRARVRGRSVSSADRSPGPSRPSHQAGWHSAEDPDTAPPPKRFTPKRKPGPQLDEHSTYSPLELFSMYVDRNAVNTLCTNTNKQAAKNIAKGKKYHWTPLQESDMYKFLGLTFYISLIKLPSVKQYWRKDTIFSIDFPPTVMARDRFRTIMWNLHMSDPDEDPANDRKKGTPEHDKLFRLRPLLDNLTTACKTYFQPDKHISIDERMVATKAHTGMTQYMKNKPTKWGFKLFVLADSSTGYTVDFRIYTGKCQFSGGVGLAYNSVMSLIDPAYLGGGYYLYVDNFYSSPKLFRDLFYMNVGACGTYRDNRKECPQTTENQLTKKDPRGTIRWIREDPCVFVKWMDSREVAVSSTVHPAYSGEKVKRRFKDAGGQWETRQIPCPTPVLEYNKHMGGVDLSDQLIQYYTVQHSGLRWYRTLFYHFLDIAATNAYILHKELTKRKGGTPMSHRQFLEELCAELCGVQVKVPPRQTKSDHLPVPCTSQEDKSKRASYGRRKCVLCLRRYKKQQSTPWKCYACDVPLCMMADRNCFFVYHQE